MIQVAGPTERKAPAGQFVSGRGLSRPPLDDLYPADSGGAAAGPLANVNQPVAAGLAAAAVMVSPFCRSVGRDPKWRTVEGDDPWPGHVIVGMTWSQRVVGWRSTGSRIQSSLETSGTCKVTY